jgi:hypothetical protein
MKLPKGQTLYIGKRKFIDEVPDDIAIKNGLLKKPEEKKAPKEAKSKEK